MEIPVIYSVFKGGEVKTAPVNINGTDISFISEPVAAEYSRDELDDRMPVLVVDVRGFGKKELDDRLLMNMRFPGSDIWFMTHIKDVEDVFDCFMGNTVKVLIPYHTTRNDVVVEEAYEVTENCMPALFVSGGRVICRGEQTKDLGSAIAEMERIGFTEIVVFDTDSVLRNDDWGSLLERHPGLIPFVRNRDGTAAESQTFIRDL
ncbi:MAG: hypothetical protein LBG63_00690 [Candidatus Methanoplasma sp.]|jgi:hypothetical protein|nr:hypothetical protein [Candidatus Methanoplasma sp.]